MIRLLHSSKCHFLYISQDRCFPQTLLVMKQKCLSLIYLMPSYAPLPEGRGHLDILRKFPCFRVSVIPSFRNGTWFPDDYRRTIRGMALILYIIIKACKGLHGIASYWPWPICQGHRNYFVFCTPILHSLFTGCTVALIHIMNCKNQNVGLVVAPLVSLWLCL